MLSAMGHRIHFVMIAVVIGILIYFYYVHKELRVFDATLKAMRNEVLQLQQKLPMIENQMAYQVDVAAMMQHPPLPQQPPQQQQHAEAEYVDDEDDDASICSNDIKDILTNITHVQEEAEASASENDAAMVHPEDAGNMSSDTSESKRERQRVRTIEVGENKDLSGWDRADLLKLKYDDLRNYLRSTGVHMKGTKEELAAKILEPK